MPASIPIYHKRLLSNIKNYNFDLDTKTYYANIIANSGSISLQTLEYVNQLVIGLKNNNLWNLINELGVFCGNNLNAALVKLKFVPNSPYLINNNLVAGDYAETGSTGGITTNGTTKFLDAKTDRSLMWTNGDNHMGIYAKYIVDAGVFLGSRGGGTNNSFWVLDTGFPNIRYFDGINSSTFIGFTSSSGTNFIIGNNTNYTGTIYVAGSSIGSAGLTFNFGTCGTNSIFIGGYSFNGALAGAKAITVRLYTVGRSLTSGQASIFNTLVVKLQTQLNRTA